MPSGKETYGEIVDAITEHLDRGVMPWRKPWVIHPPANLHTRHRYTGVNRLWLAMEAERRGYTSHLWLTPRQARLRRGRIREHEKPHPVMACVMYYYPFWSHDEKGRPIQRWAFVGKSFPLYNLDQAEGLQRFREEQSSLSLWSALDAERIVAQWRERPPLETSLQHARYWPHRDLIEMPPRTSFHEEAEYFSTLFHEMIHATGHESRLRRHVEVGLGQRFGDPAYAFEELVAEFGAAFLCSEAGIVNRSIQNNAAYIGSWLKALEGDRRVLYRAVRLAEAACNFVCNRERESRDRPDDAEEVGAPGEDDVFDEPEESEEETGA